MVLRSASPTTRENALALDDRDGVYVQPLEKKLGDTIGRFGCQAGTQERERVDQKREQRRIGARARGPSDRGSLAVAGRQGLARARRPKTSMKLANIARSSSECARGLLIGRPPRTSLVRLMGWPRGRRRPLARASHAP